MSGSLTLAAHPLEVKASTLDAKSLLPILAKGLEKSDRYSKLPVSYSEVTSNSL